jgi:asparagine synthase (glutamine-hydrolysing)
MTLSNYKENFISDLLITCRVETAPFPSRIKGFAWDSTETIKDWRLRLQPAGEGWKGYPFRSSHTDGWKIWLVGELYGVGNQAEATDELLKEVVLGHGPASQLNGNFLLMAWDTLTGRLHIWTSRFGTLHGYYASDGQRAAIGTFSPAVAAAASRRRLDWRGLTGFFACGFFPQDRTYFEDVRILRPASHYLFDDRGSLLQREPYWRWWHQPDAGRTYRDTVAEFAQVFSQVMEEHIQGGRIALPISGGLDSRSTVAAISQPGGVSAGSSGLWAYSYGYSDDSVETRIARQVADSRRLPFQAFTIKPYLFDCLDLVMDSLEGFQDVTQCRQAGVVGEIARRADYLIAAHWGDVWLDDMGLAAKKAERNLSEDGLLDYACRKMEKGGRDWLLEQVCRKQLGGDEPGGLLRDMVRPELAQVGRLDDHDFLIKAFKTSQWSFRWTEASLRMFQPGAFPRLPFYDTRLGDFFCTVPTEFVSQRRLQIDYLKSYAPDLARIKWQVYDTNLWRYQHFHTWLLPKRALKKAWRTLRSKPVIERNWEVQFLGPEGRRGLEHWLLRAGLRLHEFVAPAALLALIQAFYDHPLAEKRGYTVSMLLTFSAWLEKYG